MSTEFGTNDPLTQKAWSKKLATELQADTYVSKFTGKDTNALIQVKSELKKDAGDKITFGLRASLTGDGVGESESLEGNEETLQTYDDAVEVNELHHAVRVKPKGTISDQRVSFSARVESKDGLKDWYSERYDQIFFNHICGYTVQTSSKYNGNNTILAPSKIIRPNSRATDQALASGDKMSLDMVLKAKNAAMVSRGGLRRIRPLKIGGKKMFVMFIHPDQEYQLRSDAGAQGWTDIQMAAMKGGDITENPIFTDALGVYNNVIFHSAEHITQGVHSTSGAAVADTRRAALCGAQSVVMAGGKGYSDLGHKWVEDTFDYGREVGVSCQSIFGMKKARFNSQDNGVVVVATHAADPTA